MAKNIPIEINFEHWIIYQIPVASLSFFWKTINLPLITPPHPELLQMGLFKLWHPKIPARIDLRLLDADGASPNCAATTRSLPLLCVPHSFCSWSIFTKFVDQLSLVKRPTCFYSRSHSFNKVALHHPVDQRPQKPRLPWALLGKPGRRLENSLAFACEKSRKKWVNLPQTQH